jgi:TetR/AcrR family transcriptional regulator, cholesterol catabolism regulator
MAKRNSTSNAAVAADRREQIRALAAEMFFDKGYESTTMRQIATALKIKPGSLYYHFPNKEQILFDLIASTVRPLTEGAKQLASHESEHELKLAAVVVNHVVLHALRPKATTLGDTELRSLTGKRRAENIRVRDEYEGFVVDVLKKGARAKRFDLLDPKLTAYALIAQSSNVGIWYDPDGRLSLEQVAIVHVGLALRAVAGEPVEAAEVRRLCDAARAFHSRPA